MRWAAAIGLAGMLGLVAGCADHALSTTGSRVTTLAEERQGRATPVTHFTASDTVRVVVYVTWPDVSASGGTHHAEWNWYKNGQLVSHSSTRLRFNYAPVDLWTGRPAAALGAGNFRVDTIVDGHVLSSNTFDIAAVTSWNEKDAAAACSVPHDLPRQVDLKSTKFGPLLYPPAAEEVGMQGCAVVRLAIDESGRPTSVMLIADYPTGWQFGQSLVNAAENSLYPSGHPGWQHYLKTDFKLAPSHG